MASSKVTAIKRLKEVFAKKIDEVHGNKIRIKEREIGNIKENINKELLQQIEILVLEKYPYLTLPLKCDYKRHDYNTDTLTIVFKNDVQTDDTDKLTCELLALRDKKQAKEQELIEWEIKTLEANIREEGFPEFKVE
jgi:GTPase SAR1 family protein